MTKRKKKKSLPSSLIVTQSNELVSARYTLPLAEQRLVLMMIARIQPEDEDFKPYKISIAEFADFLGIAKGSMYLECKKITKSLLGRVLEIKESNRLLQTNWVSSAEYVDGSGVVNLSIDPLLKPYLIQLKGNFTSCKLEILLSFKSQYTMRVYVLLKQYEWIKEREIGLEDLRDILGIRKDQHTLYGNFKNNILKPVQKELSEKADLTFDFEEIKHGRGVGAIRLKVKSNQQIKITPNLSLPNPTDQPSCLNATVLSSALDFVPEQHRAKKTVLKVLESFEKKYGIDYVKRNILYTNVKAQKSYAGFLNQALQNDWGCDWVLDQQTPVKKVSKPKEVWERQGYGSEKEYAQAMFDKQMKSIKR